MKKILFLLVFAFPTLVFAQVASSDPALPLENDEITLTFDVTKGSGNLLNYSGDVYVHTGVLTDKSTASGDWKYVKTGWGENTPETKLTRLGPNLYQYKISPNPREFYDVSPSDKITHLAFVLRSDLPYTGTTYYECKETGGKDIFVEVFEPGLQVSIQNPAANLLALPGTVVSLDAGSSQAANLILYLNNEEVKSLSGTSISHDFTFSQSGDYWLKVTALTEEETASDSVFVHILGEEITEAVPGGLKEGFHETGPASAILVLYAPGKDHVFAIGDFNYFTPSGDFRMKKDNSFFWVELTGLVPGKEYAYQYLVDGNLKIADPYTEKILDPWNDRYISDQTYPGLKEYPYAYTEGIVSVFQTQKEEYNWSGVEFQAPDQENLVIYELLLRDFIASHDWKTMTDTLNYFSDLGINAIELMPVSEFEGNESWGYNPSFYFAPDKYYGPSNHFKEFIDSCHNRGIAVIMDVVFNHSYGQSPLVQLYWDKSLNRPSPENPWYNVTSPNPVYSWGYDFNHESQATKNFMDRATAFWLTEYKIDGFRFDFTKGFTNTAGDGGAYDPARISILKRMANAIWNVNHNAYVILEHFADNSEEKVLADYGMMIWGNHNYNYNEATMGWNENGKSDFSWISYRNRTWAYPNLVGYMESHDEERLMYKNLMWGNEYWEYNIKDLDIALMRVELAGAFFFTIPGPKMIWQFGEMGYDYSIDFNERVGNKPIRWDYYYTRPRLRQVFAEFIRLKLEEPAFSTSDFNISLRDAVKRIELNHADMDVRIIGNFDVKSMKISPNFSHTGTWYEFISGESIGVTETNKEIWLKGGEYRIFTDRKLDKPELPTWRDDRIADEPSVRYFPNPVSDQLKINGIKIVSGIKILDISGRVIWNQQINKSNFNLDFSSFQGGLYLVRLDFDGGEQETIRVVKN